MEEDIQDYSPTVMFSGTPCILMYSTEQIPRIILIIDPEIDPK